MDSIDKLIKHTRKNNSETHSTGFEVPENYFEELNKSIMDQLPEEKPKTRFIRWFPAVAAGICLLIAAVFVLNQDINKENSLAFNKLSSKESVEFLIENKEDISTEELINVDNIDAILDELEKEIIN